MPDKMELSPLVPSSPMVEPFEIDLEAGPGEQIQCRICLESDEGFVCCILNVYGVIYPCFNLSFDLSNDCKALTYRQDVKAKEIEQYTERTLPATSC